VGRSCLGVAGKDFAVIAADTRMSDGGYGIMTREKGKCVQLTTHVVLASGGMQADIQALHKNLAAKMQWFEFQHRKEMPLVSVSQLLSTTLYQKRFFPYYAFNVLGGVDSQTGEGESSFWFWFCSTKACTGFVFGYDAVGSFEKIKWTANGSGQALMMPLLDNQVGKESQLLAATEEMTGPQMVELVKEAFTAAGERDIYTGDWVDIYLITKAGVKLERFQLKDD
jgi:20S proteasome subunit beta 6